MSKCVGMETERMKGIGWVKITVYFVDKGGRGIDGDRCLVVVGWLLFTVC